MTGTGTEGLGLTGTLRVPHLGTEREGFGSVFRRRVLGPFAVPPVCDGRDLVLDVW
jgi:hypothetical protein